MAPPEQAARHWSLRTQPPMITSMEASAERTTAWTPTIEPRRKGRAANDLGGSAGEAVRVRRVLLATDLSFASEPAATEAIRLAAGSGAQLIVISVIQSGRLRLPGGLILRRVDQERSRVVTDVQHVVGRARAAGVRATFLVWEGEPAEAILAAAEAEDVDVIVLGSHGRGLLGRFVLGSTSTRVSDMARCRVLVVAASGTEEGERRKGDDG
jgi:nucleotide-binding universal stress UspA family protein